MKLDERSHEGAEKSDQQRGSLRDAQKSIKAALALGAEVRTSDGVELEIRRLQELLSQLTDLIDE